MSCRHAVKTVLARPYVVPLLTLRTSASSDDCCRLLSASRCNTCRQKPKEVSQSHKRVNQLDHIRHADLCKLLLCPQCILCHQQYVLHFAPWHTSHIVLLRVRMVEARLIEDAVAVLYCPRDGGQLYGRANCMAVSGLTHVFGSAASFPDTQLFFLKPVLGRRKSAWKALHWKLAIARQFKMVGGRADVEFSDSRRYRDFCRWGDLRVPMWHSTSNPSCRSCTVCRYYANSYTCKTPRHIGTFMSCAVVS